MERDIILETRNSSIQKIADTHRSYGALQYPLMFWQGDDGYHSTTSKKPVYRDAVVSEGNVSDVGQLIILPSSFTGSSRYMHEHTQDAMTYVRNWPA
ncbi:helitron_like_N domain-containing protein [Trichonephila clavipes]|nr:helitron_like_N domain-containing protein [Trichonephila clavipes]